MNFEAEILTDPHDNSGIWENIFFLKRQLKSNAHSVCYHCKHGLILLKLGIILKKEKKERGC